MKDPKLNTFFNILDDESDEVRGYAENNLYSPSYKLTMFLKMMHGGEYFKNNIVNFFNKSDQDLDPQSISNAGDFIINSRSQYWINTFDESKEWESAIHRFDKKLELLKYLNKNILYFELLEEYEKCIIPSKIQNILKESLISE